jgi:hypothetical protein
MPSLKAVLTSYICYELRPLGQKLSTAIFSLIVTPRKLLGAVYKVVGYIEAHFYNLKAIASYPFVALVDIPVPSLFGSAQRARRLGVAVVVRAAQWRLWSQDVHT